MFNNLFQIPQDSKIAFISGFVLPTAAIPIFHLTFEFFTALLIGLVGGFGGVAGKDAYLWAKHKILKGAKSINKKI